MRHFGQVGYVVQTINRFAQGDGEFGGRFLEGARFEHFAQVDCFSPRVRHFDADVRFARHAIDANGISFQSQTEIVDQAGDTGILHTRSGFEVRASHEPAGTDVFDLAVDAELA